MCQSFSHFSGYSYHFVLAESATISIRIINIFYSGYSNREGLGLYDVYFV